MTGTSSRSFGGWVGRWMSSTWETAFRSRASRSARPLWRYCPPCWAAVRLFLDGLASGPARSDSAGVVVTSGGQESSLNSGRVFELLLCDVGAKSAERFAGCWDAEFAPTVTNGVGPFSLKNALAKT
jgi:hypothetical protein